MSWMGRLTVLELKELAAWAAWARPGDRITLGSGVVMVRATRSKHGVHLDAFDTGTAKDPT